MKSVRVLFSFTVLTTIIFFVWSWTHRHRESPTNLYSNNTLIGKLASAKVNTASPVGNAGIFNNSDRYIHGCYNKGPIGTVQLLLDQSKLKTLGCTRRSPQVVIFGVRKGGTTTLRDFLSFHPQLSVTDTEIHYLEFLSRKSDVRHPYATKFLYGERGNSVRVIGGEAYSDIFQPMERLKTYASLMPFSTPKQLVVEKTPKYFVCKKCPILLHRMIPDCKLIAILVDPVKRAISDYLDILRDYDHIEKNYLRRLGIKESFEKTVIGENGLVKSKSLFINVGIYIKHIQRWLSVFPKANILLLDGGEFVKKPQDVLQKVERFLGINSFFTSEAFAFNKAKGFYCLKSPVNTCMGQKSGREHPDVAPEVITKLQRFYEPHNVEFSNFVNQTFSWTWYT